MVLSEAIENLLTVIDSITSINLHCFFM